MASISDGSTTITPDEVTGYEVSSDSPNVKHGLVGGGITVSLVPDPPRSGELRMVFASRADAWEAFTMHGEATTFTLSDSTLTEIDMYYVRDGARTIALESETMNAWLVTVGFQEVLP